MLVVHHFPKGKVCTPEVLPPTIFFVFAFLLWVGMEWLRSVNAWLEESFKAAGIYSPLQEAKEEHFADLQALAAASDDELHDEGDAAALRQFAMYRTSASDEHEEHGEEGQDEDDEEGQEEEEEEEEGRREALGDLLTTVLTVLTPIWAAIWMTAMPTWLAPPFWTTTSPGERETKSCSMRHAVHGFTLRVAAYSIGMASLTRKKALALPTA